MSVPIAIYTLSGTRAVFSEFLITVSTCSYIANIYIWWESFSLLPDVIDGEAYGRNEEIVHPVKAMPNRLGVDGMVGRASAGLADHLKYEKAIIGTWVIMHTHEGDLWTSKCQNSPCFWGTQNILSVINQSYELWGTRLFQLCDMEPHWDPLLCWFNFTSLGNAPKMSTKIIKTLTAGPTHILE